MVKCLDCDKGAIFNLSIEIKALYCATHKKENMVDVINKKCIKLNCNKQPAFNISTEKKGIYCYKHKNPQ